MACCYLRKGCSGDLISKIEMGQRGPSEEFVTACDAVPELATGGGLSRLREHLRGHFKARVFPGWFVGWPDKEAQARILRSFELAVVPGLLQTEGYARALLAGRVISADDTDEIVAARMERQAILARKTRRNCGWSSTRPCCTARSAARA
jgi:hypothetical protein